jgi:cytochrome c oxidase subunit 2
MSLLAATSVLGGRGSESTRIGGVWWLMFGLSAAVYVVVGGFILVAVLRGRHDGPQAPDARQDERFIWLGGLLMPVLVLAVLAVVTVKTTRDLRPEDPGAVHIEVAGKRWWWEVRYPDDGVASANEVHVPVGRPVDIALTSTDVIHSFWVPELAGKVDMIPGQVNHLRFTTTKAGVYRGECAEFCDVGHANMAFVVVAEAPESYSRWLERGASTSGEIPKDELAARGQVVFLRESCAGCHTVKGTSAKGRRAPELSDFGSRETIAAATIRNTPENLTDWIRDPGSIKPGVLMPPSPQLSDEEIKALVEYLGGLR